MVINLSFFREKTPDLSGDGAYKLRGNPTRDAPLMNRGQGLEKHSRSGKILQSSNTKATFPPRLIQVQGNKFFRHFFPFISLPEEDPRLCRWDGAYKQPHPQTPTDSPSPSPITTVYTQVESLPP